MRPILFLFAGLVTIAMAALMPPRARAVEILRLDFENSGNLVEDSGPNHFAGLATEIGFFNNPLAQSSDVPSGTSSTGSVQFSPTSYNEGFFVEFIDDQFPNLTADDSFNISLWVKPSAAYIADGWGFRGIVAGITDSGLADWQIDNGDNVDGGAGDGTLTGARLLGPPSTVLFPNGVDPEGDLVADQWTQLSIAFVGPARAAVVFIGDESSPLALSAAASGSNGFAIDSLTIGGNRNSTSSNGVTPAGRIYEGLLDDVVVTDTPIFYDGSGAMFQPGDLDFSGGDPDLNDWLAFRGGQGADLSALSLLEAYALGDVDFDGDNDLADFVAFKALFNAANGAGALEALLAVPEPSSLALVFLTAVTGWKFRRRVGVALPASTHRLEPPETWKVTPMKIAAICMLTVALLWEAGQSPAVAQDVLFDFGDGVNTSVNNATPDQLANFAIAEDQPFGTAPGDLAQTIDGVQMTLRPIIATGADFASSAWGSNSQGIGIHSNTETAVASVIRRIDGSIGEAVQFFFDTDVFLTSVRLGSYNASATLPVESVEFTYVSGGTDPFAGGSLVLSRTDTATAPDEDLPLGNVFVTAGTILNFSTKADETVGGGVLLNGLNVFVGTPPEPLKLIVDAGTGDISLVNNNTDPITIDYLRIASADAELDGGSLVPGSYSGLAGAAGFPAGNNDGSGWEAADSNDDQEIVESYLTGMSTIPNDGQPISLGSAFVVRGMQDLTFTYHVAGTPADAVVGNIEYIAAPAVAGDYNNDGLVNLADYTVWRDNLGAAESVLPDGTGDGSGTVDLGDYTRWKSNFAAAAAGATLAAIQTVPEPGSIVVLLLTTSVAWLRRN